MNKTELKPLESHALLSPSKASSWIKCPACALYNYLGVNIPSQQAIRGTKLHNKIASWFSEEGLKECSDLNHSIFSDLNSNDADILQKTINSTFSWIEKNTNLDIKDLSIEKKVEFGNLLGVADSYGFGTVDLSFKCGKTLYIVDFKFGNYLVKAHDNPQLLLYAAGNLVDCSSLNHLSGDSNQLSDGLKKILEKSIAIKNELSNYISESRWSVETLDTGYAKNESQQREIYRDLIKICAKILFDLNRLDKRVTDLYPNYKNPMIVKVLYSIYKDIKILLMNVRCELSSSSKILSTEFLKTLKSLKTDIVAIKFEGLLEKLKTENSKFKFEGLLEQMSKEYYTFREIDNVVLTIIQPIKTYGNDLDSIEISIDEATYTVSDVLKKIKSFEEPAERIVDLYEGEEFLRKDDFNKDCKFCSAKGVHNLLLAENVKKAVDNLILPTMDISTALSLIPQLKKFIDEVEEQAMFIFKKGGSIEGFELRDSIKKPLKWKESDIEYLSNRLPDVEITETKLKTPTAVLKDLTNLIGKKEAQIEIEKLTYREESNKIVAPAKNNIKDYLF